MRQPPEDKDRRFWLERFSDADILLMVLGIFGESGNPETVRYWRRELCPNQERLDDVLVELIVKETHELLPGYGEAQLRQPVGSRTSS